MKPFAVADAETDPFRFKRNVKAFLWGFYDGRTFRSFDETEKFVRFLRKQDMIVYAHNGGKFDWHLLAPYLEPGPVKIINGRLAEVTIGRAILRDSMNLLPGSLDAITGAKEKISYRKFERNVRQKHMGEIREYLSNDCVILYEALERFFSDYGRPLTVASATFRVARKMGYEIPNKWGATHFKHFEPYYHGGRCQAVKPGIHKGPLYFIDINSAYAYAMTHTQWHGPAGESSKMPARYYERGLFHITAESFGAFPIKTPQGATEFPHGPGEFFITGRELAAALDLRLCRNVKILKCYRHTQWINFGEYVQHFRALRKEAKAAGDQIGDVLAKLFGNGLYGKMGANPTKYKEWILTRVACGVPPSYRDGGYTRDGGHPDFDLWSRPLAPHQMTFYDVTLAAQITGHVRTIMMRALHQVRDPMYCDTDSIICRDVGRLKLGDELGEWKLEGIGAEAIIAGKKIYAFKHAKGSPKGKPGEYKTATKGARLNVRQIRALAHGEAVVYRQAAQSYGLHGIRNIERTLTATATKATIAVGRAKAQNRRAGISAGTTGNKPCPARKPPASPPPARNRAERPSPKPRRKAPRSQRTSP